MTCFGRGGVCCLPHVPSNCTGRWTLLENCVFLTGVGRVGVLSIVHSFQLYSGLCWRSTSLWQGWGLVRDASKSSYWTIWVKESTAWWELDTNGPLKMLCSVNMRETWLLKVTLSVHCIWWLQVSLGGFETCCYLKWCCMDTYCLMLGYKAVRLCRVS